MAEIGQAYGVSQAQLSITASIGRKLKDLKS
jgi:hypothetical protein